MAGLVAAGLLALGPLASRSHAYDFALSGVNFELQEVTSNLDVYFSAMRWNRISNEWDVEVTISNKSTVPISAPLLLLVDHFTGTSGPLRPDGVSTNQAYYDLTGQLPSGVLAPAQTSIPRTLGIGFVAGQSPQLASRLFAGVVTNGVQALAFARSLNGAGQPLAGVTISEAGPQGTTTNTTDPVFGVATLGQAAGDYTWKFSQDGYLPVWRQAVLQSNQVSVVPYPWLAARNPQTFNLSPLLGGTVSNQAVVVQFAPGSVPQNAVAQLTQLSGQNLPLFLPQGWSPLQAFWLELTVEPSQPVTAGAVPFGPIAATETAALVQFNASTLGWQVLQLVPGNGTNAVSVLLPGSGAYALVVPDVAPAAPPPPVVGAMLPAALAVSVPASNLVASGTVTPASSPASLVPELVTANADLVVSNLAGGLASGTLLHGEVSEHYLLNDGTSRMPPLYDDFVVAYQRPGRPQTGALHAQFPMRPVLLFGPEQLDQAVVHIDVFPAGAFDGAVLGTNGGVVANQGVRVLAAPGVVGSQQAVELRGLSPTNFTDLAGTNLPVVAAFELAMEGLPPGRELFLQTTGVPPNLTFVLARVLTQAGLYGLEPRVRLRSDSSGNLSSAEPSVGERLAGLNGSGQYVLVQVQPQQDLVEGLARNSSGQPTGGLPVSITGQPWLTFSAADGSFKLLAPAGSATVALSDPATGDSGSQPVNVPANLAPVSASVTLALSGLQVASITPADTATNVPQVSSVVVTFNRPVNPATLVSNAVELVGASNQPVATTLSLNLANTAVTLLPGSPLDPATLFAVLLSTNITDAIGRPLQGQNRFSFTTVALSARDPAAQLIIYEPGATNLDTNIVADLPGYVPGTNASLVVVHGTPGCADPGVPVILVNEGSGETGTVLSRQDGSFTGIVHGQEQDFISATFISLNGARLYIPVNRQLFDDGTIGLYQQGGTLQAAGDGGAVQVTVPQNALAGRTKFKLGSINVPELAAQLGGVLPTNSTVAGGALNLHVEGPPPTLPVQVSFPVDLAKLGYPTNEIPTNAAAMVALVQTNQQMTTFQELDQLLFVPQAPSPPLHQAKSRRPKGGGDNEQITNGFLDSSTGIIIGVTGSAGLAASVAFNQVLVPLLFGARPVTIKGKVASVPVNIVEQPSWGSLAQQILNYQTGDQLVDVPLQIGQLFGLPNPISLLGPGGIVVQSYFQVSAVQMLQKELQIAQPLSGAFITVSQIGGPLNNVPGEVFPGMVYATSGSDGYFLTVAPAALGYYNVTATHPLFSEVKSVPVAPISVIPGQQGQLGLAGVVFQNFFFSVPQLDQAAPSVSIANLPVQPAAGQSCQLVVNASLPTAPPKIGVKIVYVGNTNLLTGVVETNVQSTPLTNIVTTTNGLNVEWSARFSVSKPVLVKFTVVVQGQNGFQGATLPYAVAFTGPQPTVPVTNIPVPDANDVHGPVVMETDPPYNGFLNESGTVTVTFNKPIDAYVTNHLSGISLSLKGAAAAQVSDLTPIVQLSPDQQELILGFPGLAPDATYQLTLSGVSIRDLAKQPLDQVPSTTAAESFTMLFRTLPSVTGTLPGLANGRGAVISGTQLYALDQGPKGNYLDAYDISNPLKPSLESQLRLPGMPRDLAVAPQFRYKFNAQDQAIHTNDIVTVVGGDLDATINQVQGTTVSVPGQYLWVVSMKDPTAPQILASPIVSFRVGSAVTKVQWSPPYMVYEEFGADIQLLGFVDLQTIIIGYNSTTGQQQSYANSSGKPGLDLNGDGDYVDPNEKLPVPGVTSGGFFGLDYVYLLQGTTQKILDFSASPGGEVVGVTLGTGVMVDTNGTPNGPALPAMYRTLAYGGRPLDIATPTNADYLFTGAYPRWVSVFPVLPVLSNGVPTTISAALVSLEPDTNNLQTLAVLDISQPLKPRLVNKITIPDSVLGGPVESATMRSDGVLQLAGAQNLVLLNPFHLADPYPADQLSPAIVGVIPNAGTLQRSFGSTDYGVHAVADNGVATVVESPPQMRFVSFPDEFSLVDPLKLNQKDDASLQQLFSGMNPLGALAPANVRSNATAGVNDDLEPPNQALHYHVLVFAPGGSGDEIDLGLESLNPAGYPLANAGIGFAPVRAASDSTQQALDQVPKSCGAPIRLLPAYRVSNNPNSRYFNWYLSRPFALITTTVSLEDLSRIKADGGVDREILFSGAQLRAFIEPDQAANPVIGKFAAQIDPQRQLIYPLASVAAVTVNRDYIVGNNPPPPGGSTPMEDTYDTIQSHSGELRTSDIDMSLPSPRMPINIIRSIGNQDNYEGFFGPGWDFNYNQRLTILDPLTFPQGLQMPLVVRDSKGDSEIAGSQDVLFNDGEGEVYHFVWHGTNMPPEFAQDPLVQSFNYSTRVSDYYLPEHGLFDLLVRFGDGRFERLTPGGTRYRYRPDGRLETILDRYPANRQDLTYDPHNDHLLVRIDDHSVSAPRYVLFGYYRRQNTDLSFTSGLDTNTVNPYWVGKIYCIRDYTGRDVLFQYDAEGLLTTRLDIPVNGENGGYAGRSHTIYTYTDCKLAGVSVTVNGIPFITATNATDSSGQPVAQMTTGSHGTDQFSFPANSSAAKLDGLTTSVKMPDGSSVVRQFDKWGHVISTTVTGTNGTPATDITSNTADGLTWYIGHPEGNTETRSYDTNNVIFRSRANLLSVKVNPGPRGGQGYTETFNYDPRYNLQSGVQADANGFPITVTLTSDGRDVETIDYNGAATKTASYNANGQVTQSTDVNGVTHSFTYDSATGFIDTESSGGISYTYNYDGGIASQLGRPASKALPLGLPTTFTYNNLLQPVEVDRGELATREAYDELGRPIYHLQVVDNGKQAVTTLGYDDKGFITNRVQSGIEVNGTESSFSTTYVPDARQRVKKIIHPSGAVQTYQYDERGNVSQMKIGDYEEDYGYDLNNNLLSVKQGGDLVSERQYDGLDRATNVIQFTGTQTYSDSSSFYPGGELHSETYSDSQFGILRQTTYDPIDAVGRHLGVTLHGSVISPQYQYSYSPLSSGITGPRMSSTSTWDAAGNQTGYTDPDVNMVVQRDGNGRPFQVDEHNSDGSTYSQFYTYDDLDHQTSLGDLLGTKLTYQPRPDGNFLKVINARGDTTTLDYSSIGELLRKTRADGMEVDYRHDVERHLVYQGDPGAGFNYGYDSSLRLTNSTLRNGASVLSGGFDPRGMPTQITIPGGTETLTYDLQRELLQRKISYQSTTWEEDYSYDGLGRVRSETYIQNGGPNNTASFDYDPAGPLVAAHYHEDNTDFTVGYGYYADGTRQSITYPSGVTASEIRDASGRLTALSDANGNIIKAVSWQGNNLPLVVDLGSTMEAVNTYDVRGRIIGSRLKRLSDGVVLVHMRYQYDKANNVQVRQFVHRGGKADNFSYDTGERVSEAMIGQLPNGPSTFGTPLYDRTYNYNAGGLDYLTSTILATNLTADIPPFATNWTSHDDFLAPSVVDGFSRGASDPMGNVTQAQLWVRPAGGSAPQAVSATLQHDGLNRLIKVSRSDGVVEQNYFQPNGLRFERTLTRAGLTLEQRHYVYDNAGRLLEEYIIAGATNQLVGRYYYASGDAPSAADLPAAGSGPLQRYYFLRDASQSVIAVADANGVVVERAWYDSFGQPRIEQRDTTAPVVNSIQAGFGGTLRLTFSESVQPSWSDPGPGGSIFFLTNSAQSALSVQDSQSAASITGTVTLEPASPGAKAYSVLRFTPSQPQSNAMTLTLVAGALSDEWGNTNAAANFTVTNNQAQGSIYYQRQPPSDTGPPPLARSSLGSPFLFQGQYFDYDTGLIYLRARFYDPYSGMFFERDPLGYEDSVNHYAGLGNNPASLRDPSGLLIKGQTREGFLNFLEERGYTRQERRMVSEHWDHFRRLGMGDLEMAAHIRVMYQAYVREGVRWEIAIRKFGTGGSKAKARYRNTDQFFEGKPEFVEKKSGDNAQATEAGETYNSDLDGLYAKRDGQIASEEHVKAFQDAVNREMERLSGDEGASAGWLTRAVEGGQEIHRGGESGAAYHQGRAYQHGFCLNIPQEYGGYHALSADHTFGIEAFDHVEKKMPSIGEAFSFKFDTAGLKFNDNVDVHAAVMEHTAYYSDVLLNPRMEGKGFNRALYEQRQAQFDRDGWAPATLFPIPFYFDNSGGVR